MENPGYTHSSRIDLLLQHVAGITAGESDELIIRSDGTYEVRTAGGY